MQSCEDLGFLVWMIDTWNRSWYIFHSEAARYTSRGVVARSLKAFDYEIHTPFPGPFLELVPLVSL